MTNHLNWIVPLVFLTIAAILPMGITFIVNKVVNRKLYDDRGLPIFVARGDCATAQGRCTRTMCLKMEEVKAIINEVKKDLLRNRSMVADMISSIEATLHEHDKKRELAREDYFKLGRQVVALETRTTVLAQDTKEMRDAARRSNNNKER